MDVESTVAEAGLAVGVGRPTRDAVGRALAQARHARGLTVSEAAQAAGIPAARLTSYEQGVHLPQPGTLQRLCTALSVAPSALLLLRRAVTMGGVPLSRAASGERPMSGGGCGPDRLACAGGVGVDALTGLPGQEHLKSAARVLLADLARHPRGQATGLVLGIDGFARINDGLGRQAGDRVLAEVGRRLRSAAGPGVLVARIEADIFAAVTARAPSGPKLEALADRLLRAVALPQVVDGLEVVVTASAGAVVVTEHGTTPAALLQRAEVALRRAKAEGGNRMRVYSPDWDATTRRSLALEQDLREELRDGSATGLRLCYQPIVSLPTLRVTGAEALLRWDHPSLGLLAPGQFISEAERSRLIVPLGAWVLRAAALQASRWHPLGDLTMAVNISAHQLADEDFTGLVAETLLEMNVPASLLQLELTESVLISDMEAAARTLQGVRDLGVHVALDDFGTGYSSLSYLRHLPIDSIKLDRSFVAGLPRDRAAQATVAAVVEFARAQGLGVVAEGIETEDELNAVRALECTAGQGYLFGYPVPGEEFEELVRKNRLAVPGR